MCDTPLKQIRRGFAIPSLHISRNMKSIAAGPLSIYLCLSPLSLSLLSLSVFFSVFFLSFSSSLSLSLSILFPWPLSLKGGEVGASSSSRGRRSNVSTLHPKRRRFLEPQHFRNEKQPKEYVLGPDIPRTSTRISRRTSRGKNFGQALQSASAKVSHKRVFTLIR